MGKIAKLEHRGKIKYRTSEEAQKAATIMQNRLVLSFRAINVYRCTFCKYWHVGHSMETPVYSVLDANKNVDTSRRKTRKQYVALQSCDKKYVRIRKQYEDIEIQIELESMKVDDYE